MIGNGHTLLYIILVYLEMLNLLTTVEVGSIAFMTVSRSVSYANNIFNVVTEQHIPQPWIWRRLLWFPSFHSGLSERADLTGNLGQLFLRPFITWLSLAGPLISLLWADFPSSCPWREFLSLQLLNNEPGSATILPFPSNIWVLTDLSCALYTGLTIFNVSKEMGLRTGRDRRLPPPGDGGWMGSVISRAPSWASHFIVLTW